MPSTICVPINGRERFDASALFLSVFGLPVSASFGSFSQTMVPHRAPPQSATRMREVPVCVSHVPFGSAASALPEPASARNATPAKLRATFIVLAPCFESTHCRPCILSWRARRQRPLSRSPSLSCFHQHAAHVLVVVVTGGRIGRVSSL